MSKNSIFSLILKMVKKSAVAKTKRVPSVRSSQPAKRRNPIAEALEDLLDTREDGTIFVVETGFHDLDVVGELYYQAELSAICGGPVEHGVRYACIAVITPESGNTHDRQAVAVQIEGRTVGYLSKRRAKQWRSAIKSLGYTGSPIQVSAEIVGGWQKPKRDGTIDTGSLGVRLDFQLDEDLPDGEEDSETE